MKINKKQWIFIWIALNVLMLAIGAAFINAQSPPTTPVYRRPLPPPQADELRLALIDVIEARRSEIAADIVYIDGTGWVTVYTQDGWVDIAAVWRPEAVAAEAEWAAKIAELTALAP